MKGRGTIRIHRYSGVFLLLLMAYALAGTPFVPFHADESTLIFMSRDYAYQFIDRDLERIRYSDPPARDTEQQLRLLNGTTSKYLYGLGWHLAGYSAANLNEQWDWGADWDYNQRSGHAPTPDLLLAVRWWSVIFFAASIPLMFMLGWQLGGPPVAWLATLYYALNPVLLLNTRRAMMESTTLFFTLLVVLAGIWFLKTYSWRAVLLLGLASGLALASKHTAVLTVGAVFLAGLAYVLVISILHPGTESSLTAPALLTVGGVVAVAVFLALNPAWWDDPVSRAGVVLQLRQELLDIQTGAFGQYAGLAERLSGGLRQMLIALPQYYEVAGWESYIGDQIAAYEASPWRGISLGGSFIGALVITALMYIGGWTLTHRAGAAGMVKAVIGGWALVIIPATLLLTPLEWQRYYVPVYPVVGLLAALGTTRLMNMLRTKWQTG